MEFRTIVNIPKTSFMVRHSDKIQLFGSCFVENIGRKMEEYKMNTDLNPFGILYNPSSISRCIRRILSEDKYTAEDLFLYEDCYHSFDHHSRFSGINSEEVLENINCRLANSIDFLKNADKLIITFGTAYAYYHKIQRTVVTNCHKLPENIFQRECLQMTDIVDDWDELLGELWNQNPSLQVMFTVSPVRHWKDGAHGNQLSKSILLLAIDQLNRLHPEKTAYFPSYEILMDELRDYRFYAEDMLHPSVLAMIYIWERFVESFLENNSKQFMKEWDSVRKAIEHKPFQPGSESYKRFITQTLLKAEQIANKFPYFDISKELELLSAKLK